MTPANKRLWLGVALGAALRLVLLPMAGTGDVDIWKIWARDASSHLAGVYAGETPPGDADAAPQDAIVVDYPPLALETLGAVGWAYRAVRPSFPDSRMLTAAVKVPTVIWDVVLLVVLLTWGRRRFPERGAALALAWWLNPAVLIEGPMLGYLDFSMAIPAALAMIAAWERRWAWMGALAMVAALTKPQAVFVLPAIVVVAASRGFWKSIRPAAQCVGAGSAVCVASLWPFVSNGTVSNVWRGVSRVAQQGLFSAQNANVFWIGTWTFRVAHAVPQQGWWRALTQETHILWMYRLADFGYPDVRIVGLGLVAVALAWGLWRGRRPTSLEDGAWLAVWCAHAYTIFAAQAHENHLALALPFAVLGCWLAPARRVWFWGVSIVIALNVVLFYGCGDDWPVVFDRGWTLIDATVLLAFANVVFFAAHTRAFRRACAGTRSSPTL